MPYINGYTLYRIQPGDNFYSLASSFGTTVNAIIFANPNIDYNNLQIGQIIIIPFGNIVPTNISYTSQILNMNVTSLKTIYPFLQIQNIGTSNLGKPIPALRFGNGSKEVLYVGGTHGNEWITTPLLMKFLEVLSKAYVNNFNVFGVNAQNLFNNVSLYVVPMLNPDGIDLVTGSLPQNSYGYRRAQEISKNFPDIPFPSGWKANIEGVDIQTIHPAIIDLKFPMFLRLHGFFILI